MRNVAAAIFTFFVAAALFAQPKDELSVFASRYTEGIRNSNSVSLGVAFDRMLTPRISAQLWIASEHHYTYPYVVEPNGSFRQVARVRFHTIPIDLTVQYHFLNDTAWKPFVGVGARYVGAPKVSSAFRYQNHLGPEIVGGTAFQITRRFGLRADGKIYFGDREHYDDQLKTSLGLFWRF